MTGFAKLSQVKVGTALIADAGFTCLPNKARRFVEADGNGLLFIPCKSGRHYLEGQFDDADDPALVGLELGS